MPVYNCLNRWSAYKQVAAVITQEGFIYSSGSCENYCNLTLVESDAKLSDCSTSWHQWLCWNYDAMGSQTNTYKPLWCWILIFRNHDNIFVFSIISLHWDGAGSWNSALQQTKTHLSYMFNAVVTDSLVTQGTRASASVVLTELSWNISLSAPQGLKCNEDQWKYYFDM